jgi:hypothetical protein
MGLIKEQKEAQRELAEKSIMVSVLASLIDPSPHVKLLQPKDIAI